MSRLQADTCIITSLNDKYLIPSVLVSDGSHISVTASDDVSLSQNNAYHTLTLNQFLITPIVIKNIIFVIRFTHDNIYSIKFDELGFSVKDYRTR